MISFISSFKIISLFIPDSKVLFGIAASVAAAAAVNYNGIKKLLANSLSIFFIKGKPVFSNDPNSLLKTFRMVLFHVIEFLIILN